ncbi:nickel transporter [Streptomyces sp. TRM66268-LWL]|uniref:Nickel transporter n=1 Tax=Streptomyces polyasparticus TaxID=2767826 RepID=A0ABR7SFQ8_9ACTN|nr:nickel transporter [Streptomyces polyasparticus]MBC9713709.1 nickel transporter [Streptomyces polyasparticus]
MTGVRRGSLVAGMLMCLAVGSGTAAFAHPLGNFTVSRYHGLRISDGRVEDRAVIDRAEIPTLQAKRAIDSDRDGRLEPGELGAHAATVCTELAQDVRAQVGDDDALTWRVLGSGMRQLPGQAGLPVSRISCRLGAELPSAGSGELAFADRGGQGRIGWREVTASPGPGMRIVSSDVPQRSLSGELRSYPQDLLDDPPDVRTARVRYAAGSAGAGSPAVAGNGPMSGDSWTAGLDRQLSSLAARDGLTWPVGLTAIGLSVLLGAGHALLPGHGKTVLAACLAGRRGSVRDAVAVGATVTFTHTAGVLALGLLLSLSAAFAAEGLMHLLGVVSGALVVAVGVMLWRGARSGRVWGHGHSHGRGHGHGHSHGRGLGHAHGHSDGHAHGHSHDHHPDHDHHHEAEAVHSHHHDLDHHHSRSHTHAPSHTRASGHTHTPSHTAAQQLTAPATIAAPTIAAPTTAPPHAGPPRKAPAHRRTLIGVGIAGGLVPSPSALVVLLGAIALNRTAFGVLLVLAYGAGMAAVLSAAGLLVARCGHRAQALLEGGRTGARIARVRAVLPVLTAALVIAVGTGMALRSAAALLLP